MEYKAIIRDEEYIMKVKFVQVIDKDKDEEAKVFYGVFQRALFRKMGLRNVGRKYLDPTNVIKMNSANVKIIQGFS